MDSAWSSDNRPVKEKAFPNSIEESRVKATECPSAPIDSSVGANDGKHILQTNLNPFEWQVPVLGPWPHHVFYYVCVVAALVSFLGTVIGLLRNAWEETVTEVQVHYRDSIPFPAIFGCGPVKEGFPSYQILLPPNCDAALDQTGILSRAFFGQDSSLECFRFAYGVRRDSGAIEYGNTTTDAERTFLSNLLDLMAQKVASIPSWICFVGNLDKSLNSVRSKPVTVTLKYDVLLGPTTLNAFEPLVYSGMFDPSEGDFHNVMDKAVLYLGSTINAVNLISISYDEKIERFGMFDMFVNEKKTGLYDAAITTTQLIHHTPEFYRNATAQTSSKLVYQMSYQIGSFMSRTVITRHKSLAEIWSLLGGAWASALLILSFFFVERIGGPTGKFRMFRFSFPSDTMQLTALARDGWLGVTGSGSPSVKGLFEGAARPSAPPPSSPPPAWKLQLPETPVCKLQPPKAKISKVDFKFRMRVCSQKLQTSVFACPSLISQAVIQRFLALKQYTWDSVAGPLWQKSFYVVCFVSACISYLSTIIVTLSTAGEMVSHVNIIEKDSISFPSIFGCLPRGEGYPQMTTHMCSPTHAGWIRSTYFASSAAATSSCFKWTAAYGGLSSVRFADADAAERNFLVILLHHFARKEPAVPEWQCFLGNLDQSLASTRSRPVSLTLEVAVHLNTSTQPLIQSLVFMGLFDASHAEKVSSLAEAMEGNAYVYLGSFINSVNQIFIDYDELVDYRKGFWDMFGNGNSGTPNITKLYRAKSSTVPVQYYTQNHSNGSDSDRWVFFEFSIQSFVSRTITLRTKTFAEIWSALGGAWAAALMIVAFFFYEAVGGSSGKVKILRFNTPASQKDFMAYARYGLGQLVYGHKSEFYNGDRADEMSASASLPEDTMIARSKEQRLKPEIAAVGISIPDSNSLPNRVETSDDEESC